MLSLDEEAADEAAVDSDVLDAVAAEDDWLAELDELEDPPEQLPLPMRRTTITTIIQNHTRL